MAIPSFLSGAASARRRAAEAAYRGLLAAALSPRLYLDLGVPDTFDARTQAVTLASALVFHRLAAENTPEAKKLVDSINRKVLDGFDAAFREQGVGDASIARKVRKLAESHSGFGRALMVALAAPDTEVANGALTDVLMRNALVDPVHAPALALAALDVRAAFAAQARAEVMSGTFDWRGFTLEAARQAGISPVALQGDAP